MKLFLRPLRKGELDHELIWVGVCLSSLAALLTWFWLGWPLPSCPFYDLTGLPCVTCGATRCVIQLSQGHLLAALAWNPGVFAAILVLVLYNGYAIVVTALRLPRIRGGVVSPKAARVLRATLVAAIALNWAYLILAFSRLR